MTITSRRDVLTAGIAAAAASAAPNDAEARKRRSTDPAPNFLQILLDDATFRDVYFGNTTYMPNVRRFLNQSGALFSKAFVPYAACAPSRIGILTGLQVHNHGINTNDNAYQLWLDAFGGESIGVWLQRSGYKVGHIGKFLNDYDVTMGIPPGYDEWHVMGVKFARYVRFIMNDNGVVNKYYHGEYATDIEGQRVVDFIQAQPEGQPWACFFWPQACHGPVVPAPKYQGTVDPLTMPQTAVPFPSFNTDVINGFKKHAPMTPEQIADVQQTWANRVEALRSVDDWIGAVLAILPPNTHVMFMSDNGYQQGEHRDIDFKNVVFEESARTPLVWVAPGVLINNYSAVVTNLDTTATIVELSGATATRTMDGNTLSGFLFGGSSPSGWTKATLMSGNFANGLATDNFRYMVSKKKEMLFDMSVDPYQCVNVAQDPDYAAVMTAIRTAYGSLATCSGASCVWPGKFPPPPDPKK